MRTNFRIHALRHPRQRRSGFSLVEVMVGVLVLMVALLGTLGTIAAVTSLGQTNDQSTLAYQAARRMLETIQAESFEDVFERYNADATDDPDGNGTAPGANFAVAGLTLQAGDADGMCGRILLPTSAGGALLETLNDTAFGMPRDLSGDDVIDGADHRGDHLLLPIRVRIEWTGNTGDRFVEYVSMLSSRT